MSPNDLNRLIRSRRSVFPNQYDAPRPIERPILEEILENANWAPTHKLTEPWRFIVFEGNALERLGEYLSEYYRKVTPPEQFSQSKFLKTRQNPVKSSAVIAICMRRDPEGRVPEWEELASVAAAVQNMWLTCTANGIGSYWSTPESILKAAEFLELPPEEQCLGLFYLGYSSIMADLPGKRGPISEKVRWLDA